MSRSRVFVALGAAAALTAAMAPAPLAMAGEPVGAVAQAQPPRPSAKHPPKVRVDQLGYLPGEAKHARLMTAARVSRARFAVVDAHGRTVLHGKVPAKRVGRWNRNYHAVYDLAFSRLDRPGRYHIV